ncbi:massive surface protein MspF [Candidatus Liberibacter solanacearum]|uniref:Massive surface protein MspF n=1 Tax=Candidatus Liberibacter solanacearum TaxID=556287 RepID=A0A0F4VJ84_9HYPH|nr:hypothetical protein [Candidatus Liberibacter solanacearum]KJZ81568.1 massive surface protein MspF [Candidatus Liberibacter solanacearum]
MTYRQLRLKERSISYVCTTSHYIIPWNFDDPTTVHAELIKGEESHPLEYGEEFTVDCDEGMLTLLTDYNNSDSLHIFEGEQLKYIVKSSVKQSPKTLTRRLDDCMEEVNKIPPRIDRVEKEVKEEISKIPPKIDKVEKELKEEIKNTATLVQVHSLSLTDQIKTLDEHEKRLTETATKEDLSNLKDLYVTPDELNSILENTSSKIAKTQEAIKRLEQEIKDLKDASSSEVESLKKKLNNLVTVQEKLKKFEADIAELQNKPFVDLSPLNTKIDWVDTRIKALEARPPIDLTPIETKVKELEDIPDTLEKLKADKVAKAEIEKLESEVAKKEELKRLEAEIVKKADFDRLEAKAIEKKDLANLITTDGMRGYLEEHTANIEAEYKAIHARINTLEKTIENKIRSELRGRTTIRCAKLFTNYGLGHVIDATDIDNWQYPAENSGGHLSHSVASAIGLDAADKRRRWKVIGKTVGYYGSWHWLQEVID